MHTYVFHHIAIFTIELLVCFHNNWFVSLDVFISRYWEWWFPLGLDI